MTILGLLLALELSADGDRELADSLQRREPDAMAKLYDRFGRLAFSVILSIVRDRSAAEDLVQETFLRVWSRAMSFDVERGALGPWLMTVARNRALDHLRSAGSRMDRKSLEFDAREHPSLFVDMERQVLNAAHATLIRQALSKLNDNQREVIRLAYYEGLSQSEMSERMGQPLGTVKTWVRSALKSLREELGQEVAA